MDPDRRMFRVVDKFGTPNGHTYFRSTAPVVGDYSWAVSDESGSTPWSTDDGVLWVDRDQPIVMGQEHITLSLIRLGPGNVDYERLSTPLNPIEALIVAFRLGMPLTTPHDKGNEGNWFRVVHQDTYGALQQTLSQLGRVSERLDGLL